MTVIERTTGDYAEDQRIYRERNPLILACMAFLRAAQSRDLDSDGVKLLRRLTRALWAGSVAAAPGLAAPVAHQAAYTMAREALRVSALAYLREDSTKRTGNDGPLLNESAHRALAALEVATPDDDRLGMIAQLLDGLSWRQG